MRKTILLYGAALAALTGILKFIEYRFFVRDLSLEVYLGVVAFLFTAVGVWAGMKLTRRKIVPRQLSERRDQVLERISSGHAHHADRIAHVCDYLGDLQSGQPRKFPSLY
jgi:hypothetical protein